MRLVKHNSYTYKDININRSIFIILIIHNYKWIKELTLNVIEEKLGNTLEFIGPGKELRKPLAQ